MKNNKPTIEKELLTVQGDAEMLTAEAIVEWARKHPQSVLYTQFTWDDTEAAREFRLWQARRIIAVNLVFADGTRKFYSITQDRVGEGGGYRNLKDILKDKDLYEKLLADALRELGRIQEQYSMLKQLKPVWAAVKRIAKSKRRKGAEEKRASA